MVLATINQYLPLSAKIHKGKLKYRSMMFALQVLWYAKLRYRTMFYSEEIKPTAGGLFQVVVKLSTVCKTHI